MTQRSLIKRPWCTYTGFIVIIDYMYLYLHWNCTCWCYFLLLLSLFVFDVFVFVLFCFRRPVLMSVFAFLVAFQVPYNIYYIVILSVITWKIKFDWLIETTESYAQAAARDAIVVGGCITATRPMSAEAEHAVRGSTRESLCWTAHRPRHCTSHWTSMYPVNSIQGVERWLREMAALSVKLCKSATKFGKRFRQWCHSIGHNVRFPITVSLQLCLCISCTVNKIHCPILIAQNSKRSRESEPLPFRMH